MAFRAGAATGVVGFTAENRATVKLAHSVVATETAFATALIGRSVRGDFQSRGRILFVTAVGRMTSQTIAICISDMSFVRELRVERLAGASQHRRVVHRLLRVTNSAAGFVCSFLIAARRRMTNVTFVVRGDSEQRRFLCLLMAEIAIRSLAVRQFVSRVSFVLFGVKESVEIIPARKVALWRTRRQSIFGVVANRAGLLRFGDELLNVAFDAGFVPGEFQPRLFVAVGRRNQVFHQIALVVTGIAFQFVRLKRARNFDHA